MARSWACDAPVTVPCERTRPEGFAWAPLFVVLVCAAAVRVATETKSVASTATDTTRPIRRMRPPSEFRIRVGDIVPVSGQKSTSLTKNISDSFKGRYVRTRSIEASSELQATSPQPGTEG